MRILLFLSLVFFHFLAWSDTAVFFPTSYSSNEVRAAFSDFQPLAVFSKYRDFDLFVKANKPENIFAIELSQKSGFIRHGNLTYNKRSDFTYIVLTTDSKATSPSQLASATAGYVQFAETAHEQRLLSQIAGLKFKRFVAVTRMEDLVPLLVFGTVDYILVPTYDLDKFKSNAQIPLFKAAQSKALPLPVLYSSSNRFPFKATDLKKLKIKMKSIGISGFSKKVISNESK